MKKLLILIFFCINIFASSYDTAKNIIGQENFASFKNLFISSLDKNASVGDTITFLENNGLLNLYFKTPKTIRPTFIFINNNPLFNTKTLYDSLYSLGILNFYPVFIQKKDNVYKITLEMTSKNYINPIDIINTMKQKGCKIINIKKNQNFTYYISCANEKIDNAYPLQSKLTFLHKIKGIYWINAEKFSKIYIKTSKYDFFYPYIVFYNKNLNILNIITLENLQKTLILDIPQNTKYIKIKDSFSKENIKRGIFIKGIK